jgi:gliding motility-associated-like protein
MTFTQTPSSGTTISSTTAITITVEDENNNSTSCLFNVIMVDTISPAVICPSNQNIAIDASCQYIMPDLTGSVGGTDNCSVLANMNITQNPAAGTTQGGITAVLITLTDEQGNSSTCITNMLPDDTSAPTITCPSPAPVDLGTNCDYTLPNYGTMAAVLDNCSGYSIAQTPAPGTIVNPGMTVIDLVVTDAGGNTDQCSFVLTVTESQSPMISCPNDTTTCDPIVTFADPIFLDNCFSYMTQTDMTGLSSGMTFPIGTTTLEYTVADSSGNTATCSFNIDVLDYPDAANIVDDTLFLCDQNSAVLNADPISSGQPLWTVDSGQGTFNNQFAPTTGVNNLGYGTNVFIWTVSSTMCGSDADTIVVINSQQDIQASTQDTIYSCLDTTVQLQSNTPLYGIGTWTTNGSGTINDVNSSSTFSSLDNGWQEFVWTITSGACPATSDTLHVFAMSNPVIDQNDTLVCLEDDLITLSATGNLPSGQQVLWSVLSGSATIDDPTNISTNVYNFGLGTNLITYAFLSAECPSTYDTIVISGNLCEGFDPVIPTVITPGNLDGKNDVFEIDFLSTVYPECEVVIFNRWGSVVFESTGYVEPWDGRYQGELLPMGTYFYHINLNDGSGDVLKGDISIIH